MKYLLNILVVVFMGAQSTAMAAVSSGSEIPGLAKVRNQCALANEYDRERYKNDSEYKKDVDAYLARCLKAQKKMIQLAHDACLNGSYAVCTWWTVLNL